MRGGGDVCTCIFGTPECLGCIEKQKRLTKAISLLRRGVKTLNRVGWEKGETDDEWRKAASHFVGLHDQELAYLKSLIK